jgi:hypothetical protein
MVDVEEFQTAVDWEVSVVCFDCKAIVEPDDFFCLPTSSQPIPSASAELFPGKTALELKHARRL